MICVCMFYVFMLLLFFVDVIVNSGCDVVDWKVPCGLNSMLYYVLCFFLGKLIVLLLLLFAHALHTNTRTLTHRVLIGNSISVCKALAEEGTINKNEGNFVSVFVCLLTYTKD